MHIRLQHLCELPSELSSVTDSLIDRAEKGNMRAIIMYYKFVGLT